MKNFKLFTAISFMCCSLYTQNDWARGGGGHGGGHGGGWHGGYRGGYYGGGMMLGLGYYGYGFGGYGYGFPYYPTSGPYAMPPMPTYYIQQPKPYYPPGYWYYCGQPAGYYPEQVKICPTPWIQVPPLAAPEK